MAYFYKLQVSEGKARNMKEAFNNLKKLSENERETLQKQYNQVNKLNY
jgi:hypothetical protein